MRQRIMSERGGWKADFIAHLEQRIEQIAVAKAAEKEAAKADSRGRESVSDLIHALRKPIRSALHAGCTRADIASEIARALADAGIEARAETIQRYLRGGRISASGKRTQDRTLPGLVRALNALAGGEHVDEKADEAAALGAPEAAQIADSESAAAAGELHIDDAARASGADSAADKSVDKMAQLKSIARAAGVLRE